MESTLYYVQENALDSLKCLRVHSSQVFKQNTFLCFHQRNGIQITGLFGLLLSAKGAKL
jgi:hypothetical protein